MLGDTMVLCFPKPRMKTTQYVTPSKMVKISFTRSGYSSYLAMSRLFSFFPSRKPIALHICWPSNNTNLDLLLHNFYNLDKLCVKAR